jgi:DNA-binding transcriptional ArsR family regulator
MATSNFDIYGVDDDYMAVTNEVRREILAGLEEGPKQLPELVERTGKSKSTLSSIHLSELLTQGLVEESPHPDDRRKKIYRLAGRKIGSSNIPLEQLREAVKEYVSVAPQAAQFPLSVTFDALAAAPEDTPADILQRQTRRLGLLVGKLLDVAEGRALLMELGDVLAREGLAKPVRLDLENGEKLVLARGEGSPREASVERVGTLVQGLIEGVLESQGSLDGGEVELTVEGEDEFSISLPA